MQRAEKDPQVVLDQFISSRIKALQSLEGNTEEAIKAKSAWIMLGGWKNKENATKGEISSTNMSTRPGTMVVPIQTAASDSIRPIAKNAVASKPPPLMRIRRSPPVSGSNDQAIGHSILGPGPGIDTSSQFTLEAGGYQTWSICKITCKAQTILHQMDMTKPNYEPHKPHQHALPWW